VGSRTVRTSGYPGGNRLPATPVDVPSYPIAAEPLALPRILPPSPGAWLDGHWQLARGGSAVYAEHRDLCEEAAAKCAKALGGESADD